MIIEIIINLVLLTSYAIIVIKKSKSDSIPYKIIIPAILLPVILIVIMCLILSFFPYGAIMFSGNQTIVQIYVAYYLLLCTANAITCCFIYKVVTKSTDKLWNIWLTKFKPWSRLSIIFIAIGCIFSILQYNVFEMCGSYKYIKLSHATFLSKLDLVDQINLLMRLFSFIKNIAKIFAVLLLAFPLFSHTNMENN